MIFPYWETLRGGEVRFLPLIDLRVHNGTRSLQMDALVDSGADHSVLGNEVAVDLGISPNSGQLVTVVGAGGYELEGFLTEVTFEIGKHRWTAPVIFSDAARGRAILGQIGFFAFFSVTFRYQKRELDIRKNRGRG